MAARFSVETALSMLDASFSDSETDSEQQLEDRPIGGGGATTSRETVEKGQASEDTDLETEQVEQEQ